MCKFGYHIHDTRSIKLLTVTLFALSFFKGYSQKAKVPKYINPTGFYELKGKQKGNETYGYFGSIKVKLITESRIVINFYICKGYMSYNSGSFYDTLIYKNNRAVYKAPEYDSTCHIEIVFTPKGVNIDENTANFNSGCGFGHAVVAKAFFKRISKRIPSNKELNED